MFDEFGRRIPFAGMRVYSQESRRYFRTLQPEVNLLNIFDRYLRLGHRPDITDQAFGALCNLLWQGILGNPTVCNLTNGVAVPFLCPQKSNGHTRGAELQQYAAAAGKSFKDRFPKQEYYNLAARRQKPDDALGVSEESRYQKLEQAREHGSVIGWYFPTALTEYDLASQRAQMRSLPVSLDVGRDSAAIVLSGGVEVAMAIIGCPELLTNAEQYPHHLCLTALTDPDSRFFYSFEAYGTNLVFNYRRNVLTPGVTQVSEQFSGGLTIFLPAV